MSSCRATNAKRIERAISGSKAPTGRECEWCRGSCCDRCQWTGLELFPEHCGCGRDGNRLCMECQVRQVAERLQRDGREIRRPVEMDLPSSPALRRVVEGLRAEGVNVTVTRWV